MELYYTGADVFNGVQADSTLSLGGLKSQTLVPNGMIGTVFGDVSIYTLNEGLRETKGLILKNTVGSIQNLRVWFEKTSDTIGTFFIGAVEIVPNANGEVMMEKIPSTRALPYQCSFQQADGVGDSKLLLNQFQLNEHLGIWVRRDIPQSNTMLDCDNLYQKYLSEQDSVSTGELKIVFEWD